MSKFFELMALLSCILACSQSASVPQPTSYYTNRVELVSGVYTFYWNISTTNLTGEVHCKTNSCVSFGISPTGGMDGSNVMVGWIDSQGRTNFTVSYLL